MNDPSNPPVGRIKQPDWEVEHGVICYYLGYDLDWIEHNLKVDRASLYRWLDIFGLEKRGYDK